MDGNNKWYNFQLLAKPYALGILEELSKKQMRFSDLRYVCPSQKTLTVRLQELGENNFIKKSAEISKKQKTSIHYNITQKGRECLKIALMFINIK
jgi:DNA-binding HxlR family transcriptional regulator